MRLCLNQNRIFLAGVFAVCANTAGAQSRDTATQSIRLQVFAMPTYVRPDFGGGLTNIGGTGGGDINVNTPLNRAQFSAEFRALASTGDVSRQTSYSVGPRVLLEFGRIQPYADLLVGYGAIHFTHPANNYTHDNSAVYTYGGGVDIGFTEAWAVRADLQQQHWRISEAASAFHPSQFSLGLRYQFHFRNRRGPY